MGVEHIYKTFTAFFERHPEAAEGGLMVAVSGGPDSMALCHMLSRFAKERGSADVCAVTVDHGLRAESGKEAETVSLWLKNFGNVEHEILVWEGEKPDTRIMEEARAERYRIMGGCANKKCLKHIMLAHHLDDQAETFLMRLSKGSGVAGLAGMKEIQELDGVLYCRPLLGLTKDDLVEYCAREGVPYVEDPSNKSGKYLRPRLRSILRELEGEGMSPRRLSVTAGRIGRANEALDFFAARALENVLIEHGSVQITLDAVVLRGEPEEIRLRVLLKCMGMLGMSGRYPPRLEKLEELAGDIFSKRVTYRRTLGGFIFATGKKGHCLTVKKESGG